MHFRRYDILSDFHNVYKFLNRIYDRRTLNGYLLPEFWEYAHYHSMFDYHHAHHMGLWEENGQLVAVCVYEMELGQAFLAADPEHFYLLPEQLDWAEREIAINTDDDGRKLGVWTTTPEMAKRTLLKSRDYEIVYREKVRIKDYPVGPSTRSLPAGFRLITGGQIDYRKYTECLYLGFNHKGPLPTSEATAHAKYLTAPHASPELTTAVISPDGTYATALGMWFNPVHHYAYLEPLATIPKFRELGLATVALTDAMQRTENMGATYCFGGGMEFYANLGFAQITERELWERKLTTG